MAGRDQKGGKKPLSLSRIVNRWLLWVIAGTMLTGLAVSGIMLDRSSRIRAEDQLWREVNDTRLDVESEESRFVDTLADGMISYLKTPEAATEHKTEYYALLAEKNDIALIDVVSAEGIVVASSDPDHPGRGFSEMYPSGAFLPLLSGEKTDVQVTARLSADSSVDHLIGKAFPDGGFILLTMTQEIYELYVSEDLAILSQNHHVGRNGAVMVLNSERVIIGSLDSLRNGQTLEEDISLTKSGEMQTGMIQGVWCFIMTDEFAGHIILGYLPVREAYATTMTSTMVAVAIIGFMAVTLYLVLSLVIRRRVTEGVVSLDRTFSAITGGDLKVRADVRSSREFLSLSEGINSTVDAMEGFIAREAARLDEELAIAARIQQAALPSVFPPFPGRQDFDLYASMSAAKEVGGDFYDFYLLGENRLAFLIADVSGKGIPAAMFMMSGKTVLRDYAAREEQPARAVSLANGELAEGNREKLFITAWIGSLDTESGLVRFVNAGHSAPVLIRGGKASLISQKPNLVLAARRSTNYREQQLQLFPGDLLMLYTDGVTEARDAAGGFYGTERLLRTLDTAVQSGLSTPEELIRAVREDVNGFAADEPQFDDITMLCLRYEGRKTTPEEEEELSVSISERSEEIMKEGRMEHRMEAVSLTLKQMEKVTGGTGAREEENKNKSKEDQDQRYGARDPIFIPDPDNP